MLQGEGFVIVRPSELPRNKPCRRAEPTGVLDSTGWAAGTACGGPWVLRGGRSRRARARAGADRGHQRQREVDPAAAARRHRRAQRGAHHRPAAHGVRPRTLPRRPALHRGRLPRPPRPHPRAARAPQAAARAQEWLERFGAAGHARTPLAELSKGTSQKVAVAQALLAETGAARPGRGLDRASTPRPATSWTARSPSGSRTAPRWSSSTTTRSGSPGRPTSRTGWRAARSPRRRIRPAIPARTSGSRRRAARPPPSRQAAGRTRGGTGRREPGRGPAHDDRGALGHRAPRPPHGPTAVARPGLSQLPVPVPAPVPAAADGAAAGPMPRPAPGAVPADTAAPVPERPGPAGAVAPVRETGSRTARAVRPPVGARPP